MASTLIKQLSPDILYVGAFLFCRRCVLASFTYVLCKLSHRARAMRIGRYLQRLETYSYPLAPDTLHELQCLTASLKGFICIACCQIGMCQGGCLERGRACTSRTLT